MTDIEAKALALINEVRRQYPNAPDYTASHIAICRALEQHEAFKQEVSDAVEGYLDGPPIERHLIIDTLRNFIIIIPKPEPDPLVDAWIEATGNTVGMEPLNAALDARGLEIREKGQ
jgi:hypothetical protein